MKAKADNSIKVFGANVLLTHLKAFSAEIEGVRNSKDIEAVHRMRVASRRLYSTLPLFSSALPQHKSQRWLDSITRVSQELGAVRDNDVQIDFLRNQVLTLTEARYKPGINRLILRLSQSHEKLQRKVFNALDKIEEEEMVEEMTKALEPWQERADQVYLFTPAIYTLAFEAIVSRLDPFLALEEFIFKPEQIKEIHEMRMCAKWLRYTCETFAPLYSNGLKIPLQALRGLQEALGDLHDCDVWIQYLPGFMREEEKRTLTYFGNARSYHTLAPGLAYILAQKQQQRLTLYQTFILSWQQWQDENVWGGLRQSIQMPFSQQIEKPAATEEPA